MKHLTNTTAALAVLAALAAAGAAWSQTKSAAEGIAEYRKPLEDGNPAELFEAKGEGLWKQKRGPKNATLEACDLGKGPGVVKGAFVELPRFFADTGKVMDLETRLVHCMSRLQGLDAAEIAKTPFGRGEMANVTALATWVAAESRGLQDLPNLTKNPGDGVGFAAWPAYRVSNGEMWGMQLRLNDCYRQQRFPYPGFGSEVTVALGTYMGVNAKGAASIAPAIKR